MNRPRPYFHEIHERPALDWEERRSRLRVVESAAREEEALLLRNRSLIERGEDRRG